VLAPIQGVEMSFKYLCVDELQDPIIWDHESEYSEMSLESHIDFKRPSLGVLTTK